MVAPITQAEQKKILELARARTEKSKFWRTAQKKRRAFLRLTTRITQLQKELNHLKRTLAQTTSITLDSLYIIALFIAILKDVLDMVLVAIPVFGFIIDFAIGVPLSIIPISLLIIARAMDRHVNGKIVAFALILIAGELTEMFFGMFPESILMVIASYAMVRKQRKQQRAQQKKEISKKKKQLRRLYHQLQRKH